MQFLNAEPYAKRAVPTPDGGNLPGWAAKLVAYLGFEFANVQRGMARVGSRAVTSATTATANDGLIVADATGGAFTVTLPDPNTVADTVITIKRMNGGGNAVTIGGTVDGTLNRTLGSQYASMTVWAHVPSAGNGVWVRVATV